MTKPSQIPTFSRTATIALFRCDPCKLSREGVGGERFEVVYVGLDRLTGDGKRSGYVGLHGGVGDIVLGRWTRGSQGDTERADKEGGKEGWTK